MRPGFFLTGILLVVGLAACGPSRFATYEDLAFDESSEVKDVPANREILTVVNTYKKAMEARDSGAIKDLVSADYYENSGTTDTTRDDYGAAGIPNALEHLDDAVKSINFDIIVKEMEIEDDRAYVVFEYVWNFQYQVEDVPRWEAGRDVNRMVLVKNEEGAWKISRGL